METGMATHPAAPLDRSLRRDLDGRVLGGVCAGLARRFGVDPLLVRLAFLVAALAGGLGVALYVLAWVVIPSGEAGAASTTGPATSRAPVEVALGVGFLLLSALLAFRALGIWFSDAVVWPLVLVASGGALLWRQSQASRPPEAAPAEPEEVARERAALVSRTGIGAALVIAAGLAFLQATGTLAAVRDVALVAIVVAVVLGVIFAPWVLRLARSLTAERRERIRSQERAEMAAHLHDSVLQTLALMQRRADDPREVASLARRQERELRTWLSGRAASAAGELRLASALEAVADEVEQSHGVPVEVVAVGDSELNERVDALIAAAREAIVNAAKFAGGSTVDVYAEASDDRVAVFVRDRGPGFDPAAVPEDRHGVRESIVGRMQRHGGRASIGSSPGGGTEVELVLERSEP
jgi:signal transduction histidine kinase/phage shock protein PspC (stress-responsive transcriptional regulator)